MSDNVLADRLKKLREQSGFMQKHVADKIGVRSNTLSGYENGTRTPDPQSIKALAKIYDVSTDYLLGQSDKPHMTAEDEFQAFANDPEMERWYRKLPESDEEDLRKLRMMWDIIKSDKKKN